MKQYLPSDPCPCGSGLTYGACHAAADARRAALRAAGEEVPPRSWLKNEKQIAGIREAGRVNALILDAVAKIIAPGITTAAINKCVMRETRALGGWPTCLGFQGFPAAVCTSLNDVVCHGIPSEKVILKEGDILNVDCTTTYAGYVGDASRMFCVGQVSPMAARLVRVTQEAVEEAVAPLAPGAHLGDVGAVIAARVHAAGYTVVREIGGHGVGLSMHEDPYVCHVGRAGTGVVLLPGMIFTVEPMVNEGGRFFTVDRHDGWTVRTADHRLSAQVEYMVLITEDGHEILSK